jgi:hypothetical protein
MGGEMRNEHIMLVTKPEGKSPVGRPRRRWERNIKMDLRETALEGVDLIGVVRKTDRWRNAVNSVMKLNVPYKAGNLLTS